MLIRISRRTSSLCIHSTSDHHKGPTACCQITSTPSIHGTLPDLHTSSRAQPWHVQGSHGLSMQLVNSWPSSYQLLRYIGVSICIPSLEQLGIMIGPIAMYWNGALNFILIHGQIDMHIFYFRNTNTFVVPYTEYDFFLGISLRFDISSSK